MPIQSMTSDRTYRVTALSPVHVGTGAQFGKLDSTFQNDKWYLIDLDKVLQQQTGAEALTQDMSRREFAWSWWLRREKISPQKVCAYALPCPTDPLDTPIREFIKDPFAQAYLPGSSIKGALRTVLLWSLLKDNPAALQQTKDYIDLKVQSRAMLRYMDEQAHGRYNDRHVHQQMMAAIFDRQRASLLCEALYQIFGYDANRLQRRDFERFAEEKRREPDARWVDDPIERLIFGNDPNHDLLRALRVSDSSPLPAENNLEIGIAWIETIRNEKLVPKIEEEQGRRNEHKIFVEWLKTGATLSVRLNRDNFLFDSAAAEKQLHFRGDQQKAVINLAAACNEFASMQIETEKKFFAEYESPELEAFYADLMKEIPAPESGGFLLRLGWGGGWSNKTIGELLRSHLDGQKFMALREYYGLGRKPRSHNAPLQNPFPKTRRIAYEYGDAPAWPLGWVKFEIGGQA